MVFGGPDDRFLIAGGGSVKVFERLDNGTVLKEMASNDSVS